MIVGAVTSSPRKSADHTSVSSACSCWTCPPRAIPASASPRYQAKKPEVHRRETQQHEARPLRGGRPVHAAARPPEHRGDRQRHGQREHHDPRDHLPAGHRARDGRSLDVAPRRGEHGADHERVRNEIGAVGAAAGERERHQRRGAGARGRPELPAHPLVRPQDGDQGRRERHEGGDHGDVCRRRALQRECQQDRPAEDGAEHRVDQRAQVLRAGNGTRRASSSSAATAPAIAARPVAVKIGLKPPTATFVERAPRTRTPARPRTPRRAPAGARTAGLAREPVSAASRMRPPPARRAPPHRAPTSRTRARSARASPSRAARAARARA